jgi:hypothetical protein
MENFDGITLGVDQGGNQDLDLIIVLNTNQSKFQWLHVQAHLPAFRHGSGEYGQADDFFRSSGVEKFAHSLPFCAGYTGTEIGIP